MSYENLPERMPEPGFYFHYKHDPSKGVRDYAYLIWGTGHHTEDDCRPEDAHFINYQPLYESAFVYQHGKMYDNRPLHMFYEPAEWQGKTVARFTKIEDPEAIAELRAAHRHMYPELYGMLGI